MSKYKIRFNLGRGENYLKWKVTSPNGDVNYYEPNNVCLHMENCKLVNQQGTAKKIHDGANKTVCAWIESETVTILEPLNIAQGIKVSFNPRVQPNWVCDGEIVDKGRFDVLYTHESGVYYNTLGNVLKEKEDFNNLVDSVIDQIKEDINGGYLTAIDELLRFVPKENLIGYLPEEI
tara:strand:+ start:1899 stop:2429 length:531 start_codon:yes stop_codon:yes gene_type:complete